MGSETFKTRRIGAVPAVVAPVVTVGQPHLFFSLLSFVFAFLHLARIAFFGRGRSGELPAALAWVPSHRFWRRNWSNAS
jgi:hypothetical protein